MKAVVFKGPHDVRVESVKDASLKSQTDALVRVTRATICGSDLHAYHGRMPVVPNFTLGHEAVGVVEEIGSQVRGLRRGQRVVISAVVACGECFYCRRGQVSQCATSGSAVFGYGPNNAGKLGELDGGQAEALCVPMADYTAYPLPDSISDDAGVFLADILPTGYFGALNGGIKPGDTVAVFGCGPVGLCAAMTAGLFGPAEGIAVDSIAYRQELARKLGVVTTEPKAASEFILNRTNGRGADVTIEAVGHESALAGAFEAVRPGGTVSVIGVFTEPQISFPIGLSFMRDLSFKIGLANIRAHIPELANLIERGRLDPRPLLTHNLALSQAAHGYKIFDTRTDNAVKVALTP